MNAQKTSRRISIVFALTLLALNVTRILLVPITCDESPSRSDLLLGYGDYVHLTKVTANIHILNSILRKACIEVLGNSPFALRLPNLFAQILFLISGYLFIRRWIKNPGWQLGAFVALNLDPFLFEFWGYSRGYGLAIGFMMASIYFLNVYQEARRAGPLWLALLFAMAAVWSNFALLNYYAALCGVLLLQSAWRRQWSELLRKVLPSIIIASAALLWLIYEPVKKLRDGGELYYGGESGLFHDTVRSMVRESLYIGDPEKGVIFAIAYLCIALTAVTAGYWIFRTLRDRNDAEALTGGSLTLLLLIVLLSLKVQHKFLGTKYLIDRTALFVVVLFMLQLLYWLYDFRMIPKAVRGIMLLLLVAGLSYNFCWNTTLRDSRMWWYDVHDLEAMTLIDAHAGKRAQPIRLRVNWMHMPTMDYYVYTRYSSRFAPLEYIKEPPGPADTAYDYIFVYADEIAGIPSRYRLLHSFDGYNVYVK